MFARATRLANDVPRSDSCEDGVASADGVHGAAARKAARTLSSASWAIINGAREYNPESESGYTKSSTTSGTSCASHVKVQRQSDCGG